ncbi:hypothetical protein ASD32_05050 [Rhizobium sp. Root483D2]|nr:hypothetical protein ASD32_05050 [Rhizobium sp. Root483D2]
MVPIGGEDGITAVEAANLRANFGDWSGPEINSSVELNADVAELQRQFEAITQERDELQAAKDRLTVENERLASDIAKAPKPVKASVLQELENQKAEVVRLSGLVEQLKTDKTQADGDNAALAEHIKELEADIEKLTAAQA